MDNYGEILIYQSDDGLTNIEVKVQDETVWLTQQQMADLFQTSRTNVVEHIKNIYDESELDKESTCRNFRQVRKEGNREVAREIPFYNLDMSGSGISGHRKRYFIGRCLKSILPVWITIQKRRFPFNFYIGKRTDKLTSEKFWRLNKKIKEGGNSYGVYMSERNKRIIKSGCGIYY